MILQPGEVVTATITCMIANDTSDLYSAKCKYDQHSNLQVSIVAGWGLYHGSCQ